MPNAADNGISSVAGATGFNNAQRLPESSSSLHLTCFTVLYSSTPSLSLSLSEDDPIALPAATTNAGRSRSGHFSSFYEAGSPELLGRAERRGETGGAASHSPYERVSPRTCAVGCSCTLRTAAIVAVVDWLNSTGLLPRRTRFTALQISTFQLNVSTFYTFRSALSGDKTSHVVPQVGRVEAACRYEIRFAAC